MLALNAILIIAVVVAAEPRMALTAQERPAPTLAQKVWEHPDDAAIRARVEEELRKDLRIYWEVLDVKVANGNVDLFGKVRTPEERAIATTVASTVPGVAAVKNHVLVDRSIPERRTQEGREGAEGVRGPTPF